MFEKRVFCKRCGWHGKAGNTSDGYGAMFLYHNSICPSCGKASSFYDLFEFQVKVMMKVDLGVWWNPLTWWSYRWEEVDQT